VTPEKALQHPKWQMGIKITIDSAGLINKGLEVIEAHWLFSIPYENIEVLIHPQSIVHSMVEYVDGSVIAQCGMPDMRVPIQYALTYPKRAKNNFPKLDFSKIGELRFLKPDYDKFPGLGLAYEAGKMGGTMATVYNAANEQAVDLFLKERIKFTSIPVLIEKVMNKHVLVDVYNIDDILYIDEWARRLTLELS
jgi:1-deoxy-D-xylulose-5-phosphate reductoisomerase